MYIPTGEIVPAAVVNICTKVLRGRKQKQKKKNNNKYIYTYIYSKYKIGREITKFT